ncbi:Spo12 family-domain-containing protein [Cercophora samala]|uniref:Spo12 family-domain-containing protein n=1 Tax=Cercophora samala TaxID=330535 RepID=A0AA39ZMX8_9PEZI|nr:Spo12 family-domain-containing protein [Cercophora samala]
MSSNVLAAKDVNMSLPTTDTNNNINTTTSTSTDTCVKPDTMSMEYHRQVFQSKMQQDDKTYVSPSDNLMSPCTAKLSAFRSKQVGKVKPKSLFAQASSKKLDAEGSLLFGNKPKPAAPPAGSI